TKGSFLDPEILCMDPSLTVLYQKIAAELRKEGIKVEVFPDAKKMNQQYAVTDAKKIKWGILVGSNEAEKSVVTLKNLETREQFIEIPLSEAAKKILQK
ncbi:MAG: histidine--tRNA ligase, partial [Treponema sp.]|nr:histidine--tRNA ligase [Treponema sp.]